MSFLKIKILTTILQCDIIPHEQIKNQVGQ